MENAFPTALMVAATKCDPAMIRLLLSRGADVNAYNSEDETALSMASGCDKGECMVILLDAWWQAAQQKGGRR